MEKKVSVYWGVNIQCTTLKKSKASSQQLALLFQCSGEEATPMQIKFKSSEELIMLFSGRGDSSKLQDGSFLQIDKEAFKWNYPSLKT